MSGTFGIDISSTLVLYDPVELDFDKFAEWSLGLEFVLIRAHRGSWPDPSFTHFVEECERLQLPWGAWHVLSRREDATVQGKAWTTRPAGPMGRWIDYEPWRDGSIATGTQLVTTFDICDAHDNKAAGGYSRYMVIDRYLNAVPIPTLNMRPWWFAQYLYFQRIRGEHPGPPTKAKRIHRDKILIHQTADKLPPPPSSIQHAKQLDRNRWVGPMTLDEYLGPVVPPPPTIEERVAQLEGTAHGHAD